MSQSRYDPFFDFRDLMDFTYSQTPCERKPEDCKPREIQHVVWDADDTLWEIPSYGLASMCNPPFKKIDKETLEVQCPGLEYKKIDGLEGVRVSKPVEVKLKHGVLETINMLNENGIQSSVASTNKPGTVSRILDAMGIRDKFANIETSWNPSKVQMVKKIAKANNVSPKAILFVDDDLINCSEVATHLGALAICMDIDIKDPRELFNYIKE